MISQLRSAPNLLTLLRLVFVPFVAIAVLEQHYAWALTIFIVAGVSDGLDGLLARMLGQHTTLGQYLDPMADKLLLSTLFIVLAIEKQIPWRVTILVFARDAFIVLVVALLFAITSIRDLRPSIWGKVNTGVQIGTVFFALLYGVRPAFWVAFLRHVGWWATIAFTLMSGLHYLWRTGMQLRERDARANAGTHA